MTLSLFKRYSLHKSLALLAAVLMAGCAQKTITQPQPQSTASKQSSQATDIQQSELQQLILGNIAFDQQEYGEALEQLMPLAQSSQDPEIIKRAYAAAVKAQDKQAALAMAQLLVKQPEDPASAYTLLAIAQSRLQQIEPMVDSISKLSQIESDEDSFYSKMSIILRASPLLVIQSGLQLLDVNKRPSLMLTQAQVYLQQKSLLQALALSNQLAAKYPKFVAGGLFHLEVLMKSQQTDVAVAAAKKLLKQHDATEYRLQLANLLYQNKDCPNAITHYKQVLIADPVNKVGMYGLGACYYLTNQYDNAITIYRQLSPMGYRSDIVNFFLGDMLTTKQKYRQAMDYFSLIDSGRYLAEAKVKTAEIIKETQSVYDAIAFLENASQQYPESAVQWTPELVEYLWEINEASKALQLVESQLINHSDNLGLNVSKLELLLRIEPAQVKSFLTHLSQQKFTLESDRFVLALAFLLRQNQQTELAVDWMGQIIAKKPYQTEIYYNRALLASEIKDHQVAIEDLRRLLSIKPNHYEAMNALGYTLADINQDLDEAYYLINEALRHNPENGAINDSMGWVYYRLGELEKAENYLRKALKLEYQGEVAAHLSEVLFIRGKNKEALKVLKQGLKDFPEHHQLLIVASDHAPQLLQQN